MQFGLSWGSSCVKMITMSEDKEKIKCPFCPSLMGRNSTACRKCWRGGKGNRRRPRGYRLGLAIERVQAMNLKPGESVCIDGITFRNYRDVAS